MFNPLPKDALIAIIRGVTPDQAVDVAQTMYDAGIRVIEVPLNSPEPFKSIAKIVGALGDQMLVGAGTVLSVEQVQELKDCGGQLVVSPNMNSAVIKKTKESGMLSYPGIMTVTEAIRAIDSGADGLKIFPAGVVGKDFIKAVKVILPKQVPIVAVGGVDDKNILEWREAGADAYGLGSSLFKPNMCLKEIFQKTKKTIQKLR